MGSVRGASASNQFQALTESAFDFLEQSLEDLPSKPKFSIIHFYTALELFLKARLLAEHWSLIVNGRNVPSKENFDKGNFKSVGLYEACELLNNVAETKIPRAHRAAFARVAAIRNQMIHFYHVESDVNGKEEAMEVVVTVELAGWYFLHDLLHSWQALFDPWKDRIREMHRTLQRHRGFLQAAFDALSDSIQQTIGDHILVVNCPSCGFAAERHDSDLAQVYASECVVCGFCDICIRILCPRCEKHEAIFRESASTTMCLAGCELPREATLVQHFGEAAIEHYDVREGIEPTFPINCGACASYRTVVELPNGVLFCTNCFDNTGQLEICDWCSDRSTHLPAESFVTGCCFCDGRLGGS